MLVAGDKTADSSNLGAKAFQEARSSLSLAGFLLLCPTTRREHGVSGHPNREPCHNSFYTVRGLSNDKVSAALSDSRGTANRSGAPMANAIVVMDRPIAHLGGVRGGAGIIGLIAQSCSCPPTALWLDMRFPMTAYP